MASFLTFLGKAKSIAGAFKSILGGDAECVFVLEGDGGKVQFPVNPAEFEVGNPYENTRININSLGEINMKGKRGLKTLKFSSFFPANDYEWLNSGTLFGNLTDSNAGDPYGNIAKIRQIAESDKPAKISISGTDVSMDCLIDDFQCSEMSLVISICECLAYTAFFIYHDYPIYHVFYGFAMFATHDIGFIRSNVTVDHLTFGYAGNGSVDAQSAIFLIDSRIFLGFVQQHVDSLSTALIISKE